MTIVYSALWVKQLYRVVLVDVIELSFFCHGTVIALFLNTDTNKGLTYPEWYQVSPNLIATQELIMELLDMRDESQIDEWADYEDYDYADDAVEL